MVKGVFGNAGAHNDVGVLIYLGFEYLETVLHPDYEMCNGLLPALHTDAFFCI
jgi:hypothetical protein